jgi:transcriptional regulator with PAS, ATPase and Fis domain
MIFLFILGNSSNFKDPSTKHEPLNILGTVYTGGMVENYVISRTSSLEEAARVLKIDSATLWRKRKKYSL